MRKKFKGVKVKIGNETIITDGFIDYRLVVLKGIIEKDDAGAYFGSTASVEIWTNDTIERGWLTKSSDDKYTPTPKGEAEYRRRELNTLPTRGRAYLWAHTENLGTELEPDEGKKSVEGAKEESGPEPRSSC